ncbi:MAG: MinD/ParA family protein [Epsilonproteobacteria bacterium]|nr:MinD/ParA family protein [Campylobacterota bacterium]
MNDQASGLRDLVAKSGEGNSKFISIASGKGGVGKTNFALNFAYVMANNFKKKILLIDADMGMANIHLFLKVDPNKNIKNLFMGEKVEDLIIHSYGFDTLLGFSGIDDFFELEDVSSQAVVTQLESISKNYDYVIIDTGTGIDEKVAAFLRASHKSYILTTPEPTSLMDAYALMKSVYNLYGYDHFKIIVNMAKSKDEGISTYNKLKTSVQKFLGIELELVGILPFTNGLQKAVKNKELVAISHPNDAYTLGIQRICEEELKIPSVPNEQFWQKIFDFMGKK